MISKIAFSLILEHIFVSSSSFLVSENKVKSFSIRMYKDLLPYKTLKHCAKNFLATWALYSFNYNLILSYLLVKKMTCKDYTLSYYSLCRALIFYAQQAMRGSKEFENISLVENAILFNNFFSRIRWIPFFENQNI